MRQHAPRQAAGELQELGDDDAPVGGMDRNLFDPERKCLPLESFVPMVERVLSAPKKTLYR